MQQLAILGLHPASFGVKVRSQHLCQTVSLLQDVKRLVRERFPAMISAETSSLHKGVAGAKHSFVTLKGTEDKLAALVQVIERKVLWAFHGMMTSACADTEGKPGLVLHFLLRVYTFEVWPIVYKQ